MQRMQQLAVTIACIGFSCITANADIKLPSVIGNHMVLQRDTDVPIWGKADPAEAIEVSFAGQTAKTEANDEGDWIVRLAPLTASTESRDMLIKGHNEIVLQDILVGEVWFCSGQSNMEMTLGSSKDSVVESLTARYPLMRLHKVARVTAQSPQFDATGQWLSCTSQSAKTFSAVGYFFGRDIHLALNIPVGLIQSAWGGTPAEAWTRPDKLAANPETAPILDTWKKRIADHPAQVEKWEEEVKVWDAEQKNKQTVPAFHPDPGIAPSAATYHEPGLDDSDWKTVTLPGAFDDGVAAFDGAVWYRRSAILPADWTAKPLVLEMGTIDDFDRTYINGQLIGEHSIKEPNSYSLPRKYSVPAEVVTSDSIVIAVRVFDHFGPGGFTGAGEQMRLSLADGGDPVALTGEWRMEIETKLPPARGGRGSRRPRRPQGMDSAHYPGNLAHGMVAPIVPFAMHGAIWYQGESNAGRHEQYRTLLPVMIADWREWWQQGDFPFGIVQLANFRESSSIPIDDPWAHLRDAQLFTHRSVINTGLAVAIDIGTANDIHPKNKQDVGRRLSRWALGDVYGKSIPTSGPLYRDSRIEDGKIICSFDHADRNLTVRNGGDLAEFTIAGEDQVFHKAQARITGPDSLAVWCDTVPSPVAVRYAWQINPANPNLMNGVHLPASPFRTDDWPR